MPIPLKHLLNVFCVCCLLPSFGHALEAVTLLEGQTRYPLGLALEYLEDPAKQWTLNEVLTPERSAQFVPSQQKTLNFGFTESAYWVRFRLVNPTFQKQELVLQMDHPLLGLVQLYSPAPLDQFRMDEAGMFLPFTYRKIKNRNIVFPITSHSNTDQVFYLRVEGEDTLQLNLTLWTPKAFNSHDRDEQYGLGAYFGLIAVMVLYNLFLFISVRDRSYLYYVLYIAAFGAYAFSQNGLAYEYLWPGDSWWAQRFNPLSAVSVELFALLFTQHFLHTAEHTPRLHRFIQFQMICTWIVAILTFTVPLRLSATLAGILGLTFSFTALTAGWLSLRKGFRPAFYYLLAFFVLILGAVAYALRAFGILPNTFLTTYGLQIGSAVEVVLLSLAVADRINTITRQAEQAQAEALRQQQLVVKNQKQALEKQRRLTEAYERFVPHELLDFLHKESILDVKLGDSVETDMSVLFTDIRSFTSLSEHMTPQENFRFLNSYFERLGPSVREHHGFIDKYIGDAIMALFPRQPDDAVQASIAMLKALTLYNEERVRYGLVPIRNGVGINTGKLMLGTLGESSRMEGSVISKTVNLSARIEGMTKLYGAPLLISEFTFLNLCHPERYAIRVVDRVKAKGKTEPVTVFEIMDGERPEIRDRKLTHAKAFEEAVAVFYMKDFRDAYKRFTAYLTHNPTDQAARIYVERCHPLLNGVIPRNWDGINELKEK